VLPLHHSPILCRVVFDSAKVEYNFYSAKKNLIFFIFSRSFPLFLPCKPFETGLSVHKIMPEGRSARKPKQREDEH
jgi:hypothetical protein